MHVSSFYGSRVRYLLLQATGILHGHLGTNVVDAWKFMAQKYSTALRPSSNVHWGSKQSGEFSNEGGEQKLSSISDFAFLQVFFDPPCERLFEPSAAFFHCLLYITVHRELRERLLWLNPRMGGSSKVTREYRSEQNEAVHEHAFGLTSYITNKAVVKRGGPRRKPQ